MIWIREAPTAARTLATNALFWAIMRNVFSWSQMSVFRPRPVGCAAISAVLALPGANCAPQPPTFRQQ